MLEWLQQLAEAGRFMGQGAGRRRALHTALRQEKVRHQGRQEEGRHRLVRALHRHTSRFRRVARHVVSVLDREGESQTRYLGTPIENARRLGADIDVPLPHGGFNPVPNVLGTEARGV